jgi:deoxyribonuclease-4
MWRANTPDRVQVQRLQCIRERHAIHPLVIHVNYLINLASDNPEIHAKSVAAFRGELDRAAAIGAEYLVLHPGSYRGTSVQQGVVTFVDGLCKAAAGFASNLTVLLENTAGAGSHLGSRLEELRDIRDLAGEVTHLSIGFCLDTCHLFASGLDISTQSGLRGTIRSAEELLGMANVHVIHANDSKGPLGSHVDRHAKIGQGQIGSEPFRRILAHPKLRGKAFISETPVEEDGDDRRNLETLKALAPKGRKAQHS